MRKTIAIALVTNVLIAQVPAWANQTTTDKDGCVVDVEKDGGETTKVCKNGISIGGPINDVSLETPLGGKNAALPKAGRDAEKTIQDAGKAGEKAGHEIGKVIKNLF